MDFLIQQNKRVAGDNEARAAPSGTITAKGKHVVVIGGGDTGSDCIGTSIRQGAASVTQLEIMPQPPEREDKALTWPDWPLKLRTSSSQEEGCERDWSVLTKRAVGDDGRVAALECVRVEWVKGDDGRMEMQEIAGQRIPAQGRSGAAGHGFSRPGQNGHDRAGGRRIRSARQRQGRHRSTIGPRSQRSSPPATCGAANRWSSGRSAKAANAPAPSTSS